MNRQKQKGSVIIVVIVVLMSIVALSGIALKVSLNTSETAVNQVTKQMLENSANSAVYRIKAITARGIIASNNDVENALCLDSKLSDPLNTTGRTQLTHVAEPVITVVGTGAACSLTTNDSGSKLVSTYISILRLSETPATFSNNLYTSGVVFKVVAVSYLPKNATQTKINACLGKYLNSPLSSSQMSVSQCLDNENIPNAVRQSKFIQL